MFHNQVFPFFPSTEQIPGRPELPECGTGFPGSGPCTCPTCLVGVVLVAWGGETHDSGGIPPSLPPSRLCLTEPLSRWVTVPVGGWDPEPRGRRRDVGSGQQARWCRGERRRRRHLVPGAEDQPALGPGRAEDLLRSADLPGNSEYPWFLPVVTFVRANLTDLSRGSVGVCSDECAGRSHLWSCARGCGSLWRPRKGKSDKFLPGCNDQDTCFPLVRSVFENNTCLLLFMILYCHPQLSNLLLP